MSDFYTAFDVGHTVSYTVSSEDVTASSSWHKDGSCSGNKPAKGSPSLFTQQFKHGQALHTNRQFITVFTTARHTNSITPSFPVSYISISILSCQLHLSIFTSRFQTRFSTFVISSMHAVRQAHFIQLNNKHLKLTFDYVVSWPLGLPHGQSRGIRSPNLQHANTRGTFRIRLLTGNLLNWCVTARFHIRQYGWSDEWAALIRYRNRQEVTTTSCQIK
jgi:hypothetical protein